MKHDFAARHDWRWRAMTNDKCIVHTDVASHLSCARQSAVIRHRAPLAFHAMRVVRSAMDN
ncbi:MAG: hypothetical protein Q4G71_18160 [Pseudomonadota bacterium]|nr:hypothetical protein [Pseudomonadota bacterium]MDO5626598.1 hypothetical protein [Pseudomonadota bacterium]